MTAHKQFERKEKHMLMVVPTMGSHGKARAAPDDGAVRDMPMQPGARL